MLIRTKQPVQGAPGGKSETLCSMNAQLNNKGNGQVRRQVLEQLGCAWDGAAEQCGPLDDIYAALLYCRPRLPPPDLARSLISCPALPFPCPLLQLVLRLNSHDYPALAASMVVPVLASLWHKLLGKDEFA